MKQADIVKLKRRNKSFIYTYSSTRNDGTIIWCLGLEFNSNLGSITE